MKNLLLALTLLFLNHSQAGQWLDVHGKSECIDRSFAEATSDAVEIKNIQIEVKLMSNGSFVWVEKDYHEYGCSELLYRVLIHRGTYTKKNKHIVFSTRSSLELTPKAVKLKPQELGEQFFELTNEHFKIGQRTLMLENSRSPAYVTAK